MSKVINFGSLNIDYVYTVPHIVSPGETILSNNIHRYCGGKGANQSLALAKCGVQVKHVGCIGSDGMFLKEKLDKAGIDTRHIVVGNQPTGHAIIQVANDGQNSIVLYSGANGTITPKQIDMAIKDAAANDMLLIQNEINNNALVIERAFARGMNICLNPAPFDESIAKLPLDKVSIIILNEVESKELSGENDEEKAIAKLSNTYPGTTIIMTLGSRGVLCKKKGKRVFLPARKVDVVDTTAAGDTFIGYFLGSVIQGLSLEESLRTGTVAASLCISRNGAADSIPEKDEVNRMLNSEPKSTHGVAMPD